MKRRIKNCDKFGHPIRLQFNNQGSEYKTLCGGVASVFIGFIMVFYVYFLAKKWMFMEDDQISTVTKYSDVE